MTKTKKKKAEQAPEKKGKTYTMPIDYLALIADRILTTSPTKEIILNTLMSVWVDGKNYGYFCRLKEAKTFKDKREATIKEIFDALKDRIDDNIHSRSNNENKK